MLRAVLERLEETEKPIDWFWTDDPGAAYHAYLLLTARHITGEMTEAGVLRSRLTWTGHDYLEKLRNA